jgi:L-seryl-tRNA(Ser) seleniumtransferase
MPDRNELLRQLPKVDDLINNTSIAEAAKHACHSIVLDAVRETLDEVRRGILNADVVDACLLGVDYLTDEIIKKITNKKTMNLRRVINATGVVLHTNLGRALLSNSIRDEVWEAAANYSTLEYDIKSGKRGSRNSHISGLIRNLTGCESAIAVNNNAAAVMLALNTLADGKKVVVSRGELVEIGESYRLPDIMLQSGAALVEVGTTNKTRISDYEGAVNEGDVGAILKAHTSNYRIMGFTEEVPLKELVKLGNKRGIPVIHDLGSGSLVDLTKYGLEYEPTVQESVSAGADVTCFSGDKLLGGPQAGILAGSESFINKMKKNPLARVFRIDKLTLAALEATLRIYLDSENAVNIIPALHMLSMPYDLIKTRAARLFDMLESRLGFCSISSEEGHSQVGGGALPLQVLQSMIIKIKPCRIALPEAEELLRNNCVPVIVRIHRDHICLDVRTVHDDEFQLVAEAFERILN